MNLESNTRHIKDIARQLGFDYCGIAKAELLSEDARRLENWLKLGYHGSMHYMENYFDLRVNPSRIVPGAKSVITLLKNYYPAQHQSPGIPGISKYAYGNDYHDVIRDQLRTFLARLKESIGQIDGRGFIDSAPVLERSWATKSGLGWIGKNGNLLTRQSGSFFFIATLIVDVELLYDDPFAKDYCGSCRRCIEACPTEAIMENKVINGSQCISYFTIELKDEIIPADMQGRFKNWMFGCDICQDVCPWNRFSKPNEEPAFTPLQEVLQFSFKDWEELAEDSFKKIFRHSPIKRSKYKGIVRNLKFIKPSGT